MNLERDIDRLLIKDGKQWRNRQGPAPDLHSMMNRIGVDGSARRTARIRPMLLVAAAVVIVALGAGVFQLVLANEQHTAHSPANSVSHGSTPPLVVCGTTLSNLPAGAYLLDLNLAADRAAPGLSAGGLFYVRVADGCDHGATLTITPAAAARVVKTARAGDGEIVAASVQPLASSFVIGWAGPNGSGTVPIELSPQDIRTSSTSK